VFSRVLFRSFFFFFFVVNVRVSGYMNMRRLHISFRGCTKICLILELTEIYQFFELFSSLKLSVLKRR